MQKYILETLNSGGGMDTITMTNGKTFKIGVDIKKGERTLHKTVKALNERKAYLKHIWNINSERVL